MVTCKETRAGIIALHKKGFTGKDIAASKIAPKSTIYRIIKNFKERGSIVVKKASGRPRKSSKRQDRFLKLIQLQVQGSTSAELAQEWHQAGVSASARTVRRRLLEDGLLSRRAAKKPLLSKKNIRDRLIFCKRYKDWTAEDWSKVIFSDESSFRLFDESGKKIVRRRKGERYHQSCVVPKLKHPKTIHVWGCFSAKGVGSLAILPKNTSMNKEWYQNILREQLLPAIQEQFGDEQCLFQHEVLYHKAKVITKWLGEQNIKMLVPWPGNSPDLNPIENLWSILKRRVDKQKPTNSDKLQALIMQEWVAISQDLTQKLIDRMPGRIAEVLKKKGQHCKESIFTCRTQARLSPLPTLPLACAHTALNVLSPGTLSP
uniref:Transposase n=1 Tax=Erpetoichthys calabaricus TaxID=27687 RepID=A0A8C4REL1_ERPCA